MVMLGECQSWASTVSARHAERIDRTPRRRSDGTCGPLRSRELHAVAPGRWPGCLLGLLAADTPPVTSRRGCRGGLFLLCPVFDCARLPLQLRRARLFRRDGGPV